MSKYLYRIAVPPGSGDTSRNDIMSAVDDVENRYKDCVFIVLKEGIGTKQTFDDFMASVLVETSTILKPLNPLRGKKVILIQTIPWSLRYKHKQNEYAPYRGFFQDFEYSNNKTLTKVDSTHIKWESDLSHTKYKRLECYNSFDNLAMMIKLHNSTAKSLGLDSIYLLTPNYAKLFLPSPPSDEYTTGISAINVALKNAAEIAYGLKPSCPDSDFEANTLSFISLLSNRKRLKLRDNKATLEKLYSEAISIEIHNQEIRDYLSILSTDKKNTLLKQLEEASKVKGLKHLSFSRGGVLDIITEHIYIKAFNSIFDIGEIHIRVDVVSHRVRFRNLTRKNSGHPEHGDEHRSHPHDLGGGDMCFGDVKPYISPLCASLRLASLTEILINFANSVNLSDSLGSKIVRWPKVEQLEKVTTKELKEEAQVVEN